MKKIERPQAPIVLFSGEERKMDKKNICTEEKNGIVTLIINRPEALNALDFDSVSELNEAVTAIKKQKT